MTEIEKNNRIYQEFLRIGSFFEGIEDIKFSLLLPLLRNAAFMRVTLDELQELINRDGVVERYQNGANQYGIKQSAALQSYNATIRNYSSTIKELYGYVPREKTLSTSDEWNRKRMAPDELKKLLLMEREEKERTSAAWLEKLKQAFDNMNEGENHERKI